MKTRLEWQEEAVEFKGYTFEEILAVCKSAEDTIVEGYENGLFEEKNAEEYARRLWEEIED